MSSKKSKRSKEGGEGGTDAVRELRELRDKYSDLKDDMRKKKRDAADLEDELEKQVRETKKARKDTADLWNIYYTLQAEVQEAYKNNAKLSAEKEAAVAEKDEARKRLDRINASEDVADANKLRDALCAMQKSKMDLQQQFNDIVLQNKTLKEATVTYEPRLRELEEVKKSLAEITVFARQTNNDFQAFQTDLALAGQQLGGVSELQKWSSLLAREAGEKAKALRSLRAQLSEKSAIAATAELKEAENVMLRERIRVLESEAMALRGGGDGKGSRERVAVASSRLRSLRQDIGQMKRDWETASAGARSDLGEVGRLLRDARNAFTRRPGESAKAGADAKTETPNGGAAKTMPASVPATTAPAPNAPEGASGWRQHLGN